MFDAIIDYLIDMRSVIITTGVGIVLCGALIYVITSRFGFTKKNIKTIGVFYDMTTAEIISLSLSLLRLFLAASLLFTRGRVEMIHMIYFGVLVVLGVFFKKGLKSNFIHIVNGVVMMGILFVLNLLNGYLTEVYMDYKIFVILILLMLLLIMYSYSEVYHTINNIVEEKVRFNNRESDNR